MIFSGVPSLADRINMKITDPKNTLDDHFRNAIITNIQPVESKGAPHKKDSRFNYNILGNFDQNKISWDY